MTPKQVRVMSAYFEATEQLADATDDLIQAQAAQRAGMLCNCARFEEVAKIRLAAYRQARDQIKTRMLDRFGPPTEG